VQILDDQITSRYHQRWQAGYLEIGNDASSSSPEPKEIVLLVTMHGLDEIWAYFFRLRLQECVISAASGPNLLPVLCVATSMVFLFDQLLTFRLTYAQDVLL